MAMSFPIDRSVLSIERKNDRFAINGDVAVPFLASLKLAMNKSSADAQTEVIDILKKMAQDPAWRQAFPCTSEENPARYCLYQGERFTLNVLAWRQKQVGALRGQLAWSAFTVLEGELVQRRFSLGGEAGTALTTVGEENCRLLEQGTISLMASDNGRAYRLANLGGQPALSLHVDSVPEVRWPGIISGSDHFETGTPRLRLIC